jgi:hypothetical protein
MSSVDFISRTLITILTEYNVPIEIYRNIYRNICYDYQMARFGFMIFFSPVQLYKNILLHKFLCPTVTFIDLGYVCVCTNRYIILSYDFHMFKFFFRLDERINDFEIKANEKYYFGIISTQYTKLVSIENSQFDTKILDKKYLISPNDLFYSLNSDISTLNIVTKNI